MLMLPVAVTLVTRPGFGEVDVDGGLVGSQQLRGCK